MDDRNRTVLELARDYSAFPVFRIAARSAAALEQNGHLDVTPRNVPHDPRSHPGYTPVQAWQGPAPLALPRLVSVAPHCRTGLWLADAYVGVQRTGLDDSMGIS